jgi:urease accessory protein UreE
MLVESATANIYDPNSPPILEEIDWLDLTWLECRNRAGRKRTRSGREIRILLRLREFLQNGDVLGRWVDGPTIVVNLLPAEVIIATPRNPTEMVHLALELGNLHVPVQISAEQLITPCDSSVEALLGRFSIPFETQSKLFQAQFWPESIRLADNFRIIRS